MTKSLRLAFATFAQLPTIYPDDQHVADVLIQRGITVEPNVWNAPGTNWSAYDTVVIRSCWDYHLHPTAFLAWLDHLIEQDVRIINPPTLLRWNHDKSYLQDVIEHGVPVVPTEWCTQGTTVSLEELLETHSWERAVVKPTISATAYHTWVTTPKEAASHQTRFNDLLATRDLMVQPFIPEIQTEGEWSLLFFGGAFSHAVIKRAKAGDFRVQDNFGGTTAQATPTKHMLTVAQHVLDALPSTPTYARIDGVETEAGFLIMEVELIEPSLFLGLDPRAPVRFADALLAACR